MRTDKGKEEETRTEIRQKGPEEARLIFKKKKQIGNMKQYLHRASDLATVQLTLSKYIRVALD